MGSRDQNRKVSKTQKICHFEKELWKKLYDFAEKFPQNEKFLCNLCHLI